MSTDVPFLTQADPRYPSQLAPLPYAPPVLFYRGNLSLLTAPGVAVVGARKCTAEGKRFARLISAAVAGRGGVVISGLAYGIDAASHQAAQGRTIAVVGQGLGRRFSGAQLRLSEEVVRNGGLLLSEFVPGRSADRSTFPQRNRVIAGLAAATVVIEASNRSGSLITARHAVELGREVFAVPGHPSDPLAAGCLRLLRDGARMCTSAADVLDDIEGLAAAPAAPPAAGRPSTDPLLAALVPGPQSFASLLDHTSLGPVQLARALSRHELLGVVSRLPGDRYALRSAVQNG